MQWTGAPAPFSNAPGSIGADLLFIGARRLPVAASRAPGTSCRYIRGRARLRLRPAVEDRKTGLWVARSCQVAAMTCRAGSGSCTGPNEYCAG